MVSQGPVPEAKLARSREDQLAAAKALKSHYCEYLDSKDWARWSALFTDDVVLQLGPDPESAVVGREPLRRMLSRQLRGSKTKHLVRNPDIYEEAPGRIRVVWEMTDRVQTPLYLLEGAGFYEDRYVHTEQGWRIAAVRLHRSKVELQPRSFLMRAILWMHHKGWFKRLSASADRTLGEALYVGLAEGERP